MKIKKMLALVCACACLITLVVPTFASADRASDQISSYRMETIVTEGAIHVEFTITGKNLTDKLGCQSIFLYEMPKDSLPTTSLPHPLHWNHKLYLRDF